MYTLSIKASCQVNGGITKAEKYSMILFTAGGALLGFCSGTQIPLKGGSYLTAGFERGTYLRNGTLLGAIAGLCTSIMINA